MDINLIVLYQKQTFRTRLFYRLFRLSLMHCFTHFRQFLSENSDRKLSPYPNCRSLAFCLVKSTKLISSMFLYPNQKKNVNSPGQTSQSKYGNSQIFRFSYIPLCNSKCLERSSKSYFADPSGRKHIAHQLVLTGGISKESCQ